MHSAFPKDRVKWRLSLLLAALLTLSCFPRAQNQPSEEDFRHQREEMVRLHLEARDITNDRVLEAMRTVLRHRFVPAKVRQRSYADNPLPIGERQTISQPYIVALMSQVADPKPQDRALEIGTGSGYQAAVLAELVQEVHTIEIVPALAERSKQLLSKLGYENIHFRMGDGYQGWSEKAPFDIVLVTAAAQTIPEPLLEQLAEGGRLVMPVGRTEGVQVLTLVTRKDGKFKRELITSVRFVPMTGKAQQ